MSTEQNLMDKVVSLCKRRGFVFPSSEIYGGLTGFWDYGPLGVELKNNIKKEWWRTMVYERDDVVGLDAAIIMNPKVWEASGHTEAFTDPLFECRICHHRFRADQIRGMEIDESGEGYVFEEGPVQECPTLGHKIDLGITKELPSGVKVFKPRDFNLLIEASVGTVEDAKRKTYLRGEITQGVFVDFQNIVDSTRVKIPFGVAQIGKAFRNEITPGNFTFRSREFEQMELEYFIKPDEKEGEKVFKYWQEERMRWYLSLGFSQDHLHFRPHQPNERAHYARLAVDIEYQAPFGWSEFEGIHHRGDWDLARHHLTYKDAESSEEYTPWVIETSGGVDRAALFFLLEAYREEDKRVVLQLHPKLAPYKVAVFPLVANKPELVEKARRIYKELKRNFVTGWDDRGNIGKRYYAQDEIGTPWCVTVDYQTLEDDTVTLRDRDTTQQERLKVGELAGIIQKKLSS